MDSYVDSNGFWTNCRFSNISFFTEYNKNFRINFFNLLVNEDSKQVDIDWDDEIIVNTLITKDGNIIKEEFNK